MLSVFGDYSVRPSGLDDLALAAAWSRQYFPELTGRARFDLILCDLTHQYEVYLRFSRSWVERRKASELKYLVFHGKDPIAFYSLTIGDLGCLLQWQPNAKTSPKILLRGITTLVPKIEKALAKRGVKAIFFTSHSPRMVTFMGKQLGYNLISKTADGDRMGKLL